MSPDTILTRAKQRYNAVGDTFFSSEELYAALWAALQEMAIETRCLRFVQSTTTVVGQREYAKPTQCMAVKMVTYDGKMLVVGDFLDDAAYTAYDEDTTNTGVPVYYTDWGDSIYLRPIPNDTKTLKIWFYAKPQEVTALSTIECPEEYQLMTVDYLLHHMFAKDNKRDMAAFHLQLWEASIAKIKSWERRKLRDNNPAVVKNIDRMNDLWGIL